MLGRREQHLALPGPRMRAALEPVLLERLDAVARVHPAAALGRRRPQARNMRHLADSTRASAPLVERQRARDADVERLRAGSSGIVALSSHSAITASGSLPLRAEHEGRPLVEIQLVERLSAVRDERDDGREPRRTPPVHTEDRARRCPERLGAGRVRAAEDSAMNAGPESVRRRTSVPMLPGSATFQRASPTGGGVRVSSRGRSSRRKTQSLAAGGQAPRLPRGGEARRARRRRDLNGRSPSSRR